MKFPKMKLPKSLQEWQAARTKKKETERVEKLSRELNAAICKGAPLEKVKELIEKGADPAFKSAVAVYNAAVKNNIDAVKILLSNGFDVNNIANNGTTFSYAFRNGNRIKIAEFLLEQNLDINNQMPVGYPSPLFTPRNKNLKKIELIRKTISWTSIKQMVLVAHL